jgi:hypothetical protein
MPAKDGIFEFYLPSFEGRLVSASITNVEM